MAVHSTRRIIWNAADGAIGDFTPTAAVTWRGTVAFNEPPPEEPPGVYAEGSQPAAFMSWEQRGAQNPQGQLGGGVATGQGTLSWTIFVQMGAGPEWFEDLDEEVRTLLDAVDKDATGAVFVTEAVVDVAAGVSLEGWAAVTYSVPAHVVGDYT